MKKIVLEDYVDESYINYANIIEDLVEKKVLSEKNILHYLLQELSHYEYVEGIENFSCENFFKDLMKSEGIDFDEDDMAVTLTIKD